MARYIYNVKMRKKIYIDTKLPCEITDTFIEIINIK